MLQTLPPPAHRRAATENGVRRAVALPVPVRRGVAVVAVAGGALSLAAAAVPDEPGDPPARDSASGAVLDVGGLAANSAVALTTDMQGVSGPSAGLEFAVPEPAVPEPAVLDPATLARAVQRAGREAEQRQRTVAQGGHADEVRAAEEKQRAQAEEERHADVEHKGSDAHKTAEKAERSSQQPPADAADCGLDTAGLGRVKPHVRAAAEVLGCRYGEPEMVGIARRGGPSDHPRGLAVDFMVDRVTGDALAACALKNKDALGVAYVIWRQRMNDGSGWKRMDERGGTTANHMDHVHASFEKAAGGSTPPGC